MIATLLSASVGVPYVVSQQQQAAKVAATPAAAANAAPATTATAQQATSTPHDPFAQPPPPAATPSPAPPAPVAAATSTQPATKMHPVETVLRFDLTRDWVYRNWDRKTTGPTDVGLMAVRVTLVSGTELSSITGSLTYFFNEKGAIEHISFHGRTGDATRLVEFLKRTYLFEETPSPFGEQVYQVKRSSKVHSELRIRPEPVLRSGTPHGNILVDLELARPGTNRFLPPRNPTLPLPPVAAAATATPATADATAAASGSAESYFDKARYATPQEEGQVLWKRWPN